MNCEDDEDFNDDNRHHNFDGDVDDNDDEEDFNGDNRHHNDDGDVVDNDDGEDDDEEADAVFMRCLMGGKRVGFQS